MSCEQFLLQVPDLIEGSLSAAQARPLEAHAASCEECAAVLDDFLAIRTDLRPALEQSIDPAMLTNVRTAVLQRLSEAPSVGFFGAWRLRFALGLASVAAFAVGWQILERGQPQPGPIVAAARPAPVLTPPAHVPDVTAPVVEPEPHPVEQPQAEIEVFAINTPPESEPDAAAGVILKLPSTNPDVVLYWVSETQGGS